MNSEQPSLQESFDQAQAAWASADRDARGQLMGRLIQSYFNELENIAQRRSPGPVGGPVGPDSIPGSLTWRALHAFLVKEEWPFENLEKFKAYMSASVRNWIRDRQRRTAKQPRVFSVLKPTDADGIGDDWNVADDDPSPSENVAKKDFTAVFWSNAQKILKPNEYKLLRRAVVELADHAELAKEFDLTEDAVRMRLARIREKLKKNLRSE